MANDSHKPLVFPAVIHQGLRLSPAAEQCLVASRRVRQPERT
jgi:hypothetical protein